MPHSSASRFASPKTQVKQFVFVASGLELSALGINVRLVQPMHPALPAMACANLRLQVATLEVAEPSGAEVPSALNGTSGSGCLST